MIKTRVLTLISFLILGAFFVPAGQVMCMDIEEKLDFTLRAPENEIHKRYLGLGNNDSFQLGQIKADIVIIEIFSMYCPICQGEAANVNTLFQQIQSNDSLKEKIKLIGIGAGNSPFEVEFFKNKYAIKFPLFSDPDFFIHKKIGEVGTPHFFGLALKQNGEFSVFYSQSGKVSNPERFLENFLKNSGLKKLP